MLLSIHGKNKIILYSIVNTEIERLGSVYRDVVNWRDHMYYIIISQSAHSLGNKNEVCGNEGLT